MTTLDEDPAGDLAARDVAWDLAPLLELGGGDVAMSSEVDTSDAALEHALDDLLDAADAIAAELVASGRGRIASMTPVELATFHGRYAELLDRLGRAESYAGLRFAGDTADPANGARVAKVQERATAIAAALLFVDLEWAAAPDEHVEAVLADPLPALDPIRHHLRASRRWKPHLLSEPEERILTEKGVVGAAAWARLFDELTSAIQLELAGADGVVQTASLEEGLSRLAHPDRDARVAAHAAVTAGLQPGLRTRAYVFNTLLNDRAIEDRLRGYGSWISNRNLSNEASDSSVEALVAAVVRRYDIPHRWYALKARILGLDRLADHDRMASIATSESTIGWSAATDVVLDAYASFSDELAGIVRRFLTERWIDAEARAGKRPGAFCAYTVPSHHPYILLNWTARPRDVATLAHELGHGVHAYLARSQGAFQMATPLTLAETASVFGETVTSTRMLAALDDPGERLALLAATLEDSIATVFRQIAMNRFEHAVHTARRAEGELSVDRFAELWSATQADVLGPAVEITEGYRSWWSYIPHFMHTPGYVYAYAYGQLLALSVYRRFEQAGSSFVPQYLDLLRAGGSRSPQELGRIVECDLDDPAFWDGGLDIVAGQLAAAEAAAHAAGRL